MLEIYRFTLVWKSNLRITVCLLFTAQFIFAGTELSPRSACDAILKNFIDLHPLTNFSPSNGFDRQLLRDLKDRKQKTEKLKQELENATQAVHTDPSNEQALAKLRQVNLELKISNQSEYLLEFLERIKYTKHNLGKGLAVEFVKSVDLEIGNIVEKKIEDFDLLPPSELRLIISVLKQWPALKNILLTGKGTTKILDGESPFGDVEAEGIPFSARGSHRSGGSISGSDIRVVVNPQPLGVTSAGLALIHELIHKLEIQVLSKNKDFRRNLTALYKEQLKQANVTRELQKAVWNRRYGPNLLGQIFETVFGTKQATLRDVRNNDLINKYFHTIFQIGDESEYLAHGVEAYWIDKINGGTMALGDKDPKLREFIETVMTQDPSSSTTPR